MDIGYISSKELNRFDDKLNVECETKRVIKEDFFRMESLFTKVRAMGVLVAMGGITKSSEHINFERF